MRSKIIFFNILLLITNNSYSQIEPDKNLQNLNFIKSFSQEKDSEFYKLYNFFKDFFVSWEIKTPLNVELSAKVSSKGINSKRYDVQIHKDYLKKNNAQIDHILSFIPDKTVKLKIKDYITKDPDNGSFMYGIDFKNSNPNYKVYYNFLYGRKVGIVIDSYEWGNDKDKQITRRTYKDIQNYEDLLNKILSIKQKQAFNKLKKFLNLSFVLIKNDDGKDKLLEFKFNDNVKIQDIKKELLDFLNSYYSNTQDLNNFLTNFEKIGISWIAFGKSEVTIYIRLQKWI